MERNTEHLAVSILADHQVDLLKDLTKSIDSSDCKIQNCDYSHVGSLSKVTVLLSGKWNSLAKLEQQLQQMKTVNGIQLHYERYKSSDYQEGYMPYIIYLVGKNDASTLARLCSFVGSEEAKIDAIEYDSFLAKRSGTEMCSINLEISIPEKHSISAFRENFIDFCEKYNLDGMMEPDKG